MKNINKILFAFALLASLALAQFTPSFTATTLSAAITPTIQQVTLAACTGVSATASTLTLLKIDDEFLQPTSITSTSPCVVQTMRGASGSRALAHPSGMPVYIATGPAFSACAGSSGQTPCGDGYNSRTITHYSSSLWYSNMTPAAISTQGAVTYTVGQLLSGIIQRNTNGAIRTDTLPTAALLVAGVPGAMVGTTFDFLVYNTGTTDTLTIAVGSGMTAATANTLTIPTLDAKQFRIRFTNVTKGNEAVTLYSLGLVVF